MENENCNDIGPFKVLQWPRAPGEVGHAIHKVTHENAFIKCEWLQPLAHEALTLQAAAGGVGIPAFHWLETINGKDIMLMEPHGPSLEEVFHQSGRYISVQTLLGFADQLLSRVEFIHSRNIIHGNLTPWSFALGLGWQTQQLLLVDLNTQGDQHTASDDLNAVSNILNYLYSGAESWEDYQEGGKTIPPFDIFRRAISTRSDSINYDSLHRIFQEAYKDLAVNMAIALDLAGPRAIGDGLSPNMGALSMLTTNELFDSLEAALRDAGTIATQGLSGETTIRSFEDILDIYLVLLVRDRPSWKKEEYLGGAYYLPNRIWRDIRWFLSRNLNSLGTVRLELNAQAYRFMTAAYEIKPSYRRYWVSYLLLLSRERKEVEPPCGKAAWIQTIFYWQDIWNKLVAEESKRKEARV
ncbi:kinase-like domain-containing protein [Aspergillus granulosus]|uniref:Kinase-like domain-containing protein n=1 Tax=Aspergillus granulosus TaxID=176169 RepID=A0ABR4GV68_9EURO